jgi:predicted alpha/beta-hydrolase family hydrolase
MATLDSRDVRTASGPIPTRVYLSDTGGGATLVLAPGAGASHAHPFLVAVSSAVADAGVHVVTFDFAYMAAGRKLPDRLPTLVATYTAVVEDVRERMGGAIAVGGKSMGARVAAVVRAADPDLVAYVALGYPLCPPGRPAERAPREATLANVPGPGLVVQGERDAFGSSDVMAEVLRGLDPEGARWSLEAVAGADHGFAVPKRGRAADAEPVEALVGRRVAAFVRRAAGVDGA